MSDTHGDLEVASKASDVLSDVDSYPGSDEEQADTSHIGFQEEDGETDLTSTSESETEGVKRKVLKNCIGRKAIRSQETSKKSVPGHKRDRKEFSRSWRITAKAF